MVNSFTKLSLILLLMLSFIAPNLLRAEEIDESEISSKLPHLLGTNNVGKKFMLTLPPPYEEVSGDNFMRIFIISAEQTVVTIKNELGYFKQNKINPYQLLAVDISASVAVPYTHNPGMKVRPASIYPGKGMQIESGSPIVVYVIARFKYTSDGYLALPVNGLGKEYIAATIHELNWASSQRYPPWVTVVGVYDNTTVNLTMGGSTRALSRMMTEDGKTLKAGDKYKFTLNKGDVFLGGADGLMADLSGTKIQANKPVSFITGHFCNQVPNGTPACDYSVEMPFPTNTWGKMYLVPALPHRKKPGLVTIMAKEPNTTVWRDGAYFCTIKKPGGGDDQQGAYFTDRIWPIDAYPSKQAVFTSDKPISVMYFNPGGTDDNVATDPFWMTITPMEQFQSAIAFCTPNAAGGERYSKNFLNFSFECDQFGLMPEDLEWAYLDVNNPKWIPARDVFTGAVQYYWKDQKDPNAKTYGFVVIQLPGEGVFGLRSATGNTKFSAYSYGDADWDSYGYPTAAALADLDIQDTMNPVPKFIVTCDGNVDKETTTVTDYPYPLPAEERSNMSEMYMILDSSYNYEFLEGEIISGETVTTNWGLKLLDPSKDGRAMIRFVDRAGNDTVITVEYHSIAWEIRADQDYGKFKLGDPSVTKDFEIENKGNGKMVLKELRLLSLKGYQGFTLEPLTWDIKTPFEPKETRKFQVTFTADNKLPNAKIFEDVIVAMDTCLLVPKEVRVSANTGAPKIEVSDEDFGVNSVGVKTAARQITIRNSGDADLSITGYTANTFTANYDVQWNGLSFSAANPVVIKPGGEENFSVAFTATGVQKYPDQIIFISDAGTYVDNVCNLNGEGVQADLTINGYSWQTLRIHRTKFPTVQEPSSNDTEGQLPVTIKNTGTATATVSAMAITVTTNEYSTAQQVKESFFLKDQNGTIKSLAEWEAGVFPTTPLQAGAELVLAAYFRPVAIGKMAVELSFTNSLGKELVATLEGAGKVPSVKITPSHNFGKTLMGDYANEQDPNPTIEIEAYSGPYDDVVEIKNIIATAEISNDINNFNGKAFKYDGTKLYKDQVLVRGQKLTVPAKFVAPSNQTYTATLTLETDAEVLTERPGFDNFVSNWNGFGTAEGSSISGGASRICIEAQDKITITIENTGDEDIVVTSLSFPVATPFLTWASTGNNNALTNIALKSKEIKQFDLDFKPLANLAQTDVTVTMVTDELTNNTKTTDVRIEAYSSTATSESMVSRSELIYGQDFVYKIKYIPNGKVSESAVKELRVNINFKDDHIKAILNGSKVNDPSAYTLKLVGDFAGKFEIVNPQSVAVVDAGLGTSEKQISFVVRALGNNILGDNASDMIELSFRAYLPSYSANSPINKDFEIDITHGIFDLNTDKCFVISDPKQTKTKIAEICAYDFRPILTGAGYYLQSINPNPVDGNGADIVFSVGYEEAASLRIIDATGNVVSELINGIVKAGEQNVRIPIETLSNGVYFYQIKSGAYQETKQLVINK